MKYWHAYTDTFSSVGFKLRLERNYNKHILSYYLPSLLIVVLSWVSFVIPPEVIPGRMALLINLVLVLVNMFGTVIDQIPPTKTTVLDVWMIGCLIFVSVSFCVCLMAYAALLFHQRFSIQKSLMGKVKKVEPADGQHEKQFTDSEKNNSTHEYMQWDRYFLIGFPLAALTFNFIYWPVVFIKRQTL